MSILRALEPLKDTAVAGARIGGICTYAVFAIPCVVGRSKAAEMLFACDYISGGGGF